jgi:lipoyl(octanoyl) transferase
MKVARIDTGLQSYARVWAFQKQCFEEAMQRRKQGLSPDSRLILVEHTPVYTFGRNAKRENLLADEDWLRSKGAEIHHIERGGDITFHGPGQLVAYPMFDLLAMEMGVRKFVESVETAIIDCIGQYGIDGRVVSDRPGVWVGVGTPEERKIAALGVYCSRHYTMHGLALNVTTDLNWFSHMVPCGIPDKGVTSMELEAGRKLPLWEVADSLASAFERHFPVTFVRQSFKPHEQ